MFYFLELCSKLKLHGFKFAFDGHNIDVEVSQFGLYSAVIDLDNGLSTKLFLRNSEKGHFDFNSVDDFIDWAKKAYNLLSCLES